MLKLRRLIISIANLIFPYIILHAGEYLRDQHIIATPDAILYPIVILFFAYHIFRVYKQIRLLYIEDRVIDLGFSYQIFFLHTLVAGLFLFFAVIKKDEYGDPTINFYHIISVIIFFIGIITGDQNIILNKDNIYFNFLKRTRVLKKDIVSIYVEMGFLIIETNKGKQKLQLRNYAPIVVKNFERIRASIFEVYL